jgi:hypothetical protein
MTLIETIGWIGSFVGISAYILLSCKKITPTSHTFLIMNMIAATMLILMSYSIDNPQGIFINVSFLTFSILPLIGVKIVLHWINLNFFFIVIFSVTIISTLINYTEANLYWLYDVVGWMSVVAFPLAFLILTQGKIPEMTYFKLNAFFCILIFFHLHYEENYPLFFLEIFFFVVSIYGILTHKKTLISLTE